MDATNQPNPSDQGGDYSSFVALDGEAELSLTCKLATAILTDEER
jgi:hypothetical protein